MDLWTAIGERRSIRVFRHGPLPEGSTAHFEEAIRAAPSAGNVQARHFSFVTNADDRAALARASLQPDVVGAAPLVVVGCTHARIQERYGTRGRRLFAVQDVAAATQNLLLAVHAAGLGAVWIGAFDPRAVRRALHLAPELTPTVLVPIGRPGESPAPPERLPDAVLFSHVD